MIITAGRPGEQPCWPEPRTRFPARTTAFELLESLIGNGQPEPRDVVLPTRLIRRESCGC